MRRNRSGSRTLGRTARRWSGASNLQRLPFFYGWVIVAVAFVTMGVGVNARTAFSLLFPPILDEFGWERGMTAGAFSFGFLVSAILSPCVGRLMDRHGPRVVIEIGVGLMATGLMLAPLLRQPWHLYATLGVLVSGGTNCLGYTGQSLFLPNWFVRQRGLAMSVAFSGVGVGAILVLPWLQELIGRAGWRAACWAMGILVLALLAPLNLLLKQRPEDLGLGPDGEPSLHQQRCGQPDGQRRGRDLGRRGLDARPRHAHGPLLVDRRGIFLRLVRLVRRAGAPDEICDRDRFQRDTGGLGPELREPGRYSWPNRPRLCVGPYRARMGMDGRQPGLRAVLPGPARPPPRADANAACPHGGLAGDARLWTHLSPRCHPGRDLPGRALRDDLRHADAGRHRGRSRRAVGDRCSA